MRSTTAVVLALTLVKARDIRALGDGTRYAFYRAMDDGRRAGAAGGGRRMFGGQAEPLEAYGAAGALLDRYWAVRCSAAVVAPAWALTAAHCVGAHLAYVKYNSRRPSSPDGDAAPVLFLYRHPGYRVQRNEGADGVDVSLLHHDVGLVRTRSPMRLAAAPPASPLRSLHTYGVAELRGELVHVLGFGRTDASPLGEQLFGVRLRAVPCQHGGWMHCVCGVGDEGGAGVCSGDSGGPVLFRGVQVGVTSMGPVQCGGWGAGAAPPPDATSVFTALHPYADLVLATINETDAALKMRRLQNSGAGPPRPPCPPARAAALALLLVCLRASLSNCEFF